MNKFDSTLLPQTNNTEEIQKGNLDLLAKINATILFIQEGIVTFAQEILKVLSTYIWPASRVSFTPGASGLVATDAQALGLELANPINTKASVVDTDTVTGNDTADSGKVKKWTWATVKAWVKTFTWNSTTDGNGGQPPAPKPSATPIGGTDAVGQSYTDIMTAGNTLYYSGAINRTGTWRIVSLTVATAGTVNLGLTNMGANGSGVFFTVPAGHSVVFATVRTS